MSCLSAVLLLVAACGERGGSGAEGIDVRPQWVEGRSYTYREARQNRVGGGAFPPEGELLARTELSTEELRVYRIDVVEALGPALHRARITYLTSLRGRADELAPDLLAGKSFLVLDPLGEMRLEVEEGESRRPATVQEADAVRATALRMAASLLPNERVEPGAVWHPGRDPGAFARQGRGPITMTSRLSEIDRRDGQEFAVVAGRTEASVAEGPNRGARIVAEETVHLNLDARRIETYHWTSDWTVPPEARRREEWRRTTIDLSLVPE